MLRRRLWRIPIWLATGVFGAWVADLYLPGFELDGSLTARLVVGGVVAGLFMAAAVVLASGGRSGPSAVRSPSDWTG